MYDNIKKVEQIPSLFDEDDEETKLINRFLKAGWILLDISRRGYDNSNDDGSASFVTVFTLGHADIDAINPLKQDRQKRKEAEGKHQAMLHAQYEAENS